MIYQNERAIYVKIADRLCDDILSGKYKEEERVPSIRELAAEYEVNTNTVLRTFDILQRDEIIYQKRGIGVFVSHGALRRIRSASGSMASGGNHRSAHRLQQQRISVCGGAHQGTGSPWLPWRRPARQIFS